MYKTCCLTEGHASTRRTGCENGLQRETMARINPDPYAGGQMFALANQATGLVDTDEEARSMVRSLEEAEEGHDELVMCGTGARRTPDL